LLFNNKVSARMFKHTKVDRKSLAGSTLGRIKDSS
jgi:hypothetical protein